MPEREHGDLRDMPEQGSRKFAGRMAEKQARSGFEEARGYVVVAVKLDIIESGGDAEPAGHGGGLDAANACPGGENNIAEAERSADEDDFKLDRRGEKELLGAEKIDAGGTDVAGDKGDGIGFGDARRRAKAKGEI